jgi:hypothetical protein
LADLLSASGEVGNLSTKVCGPLEERVQVSGPLFLTCSLLYEAPFTASC